MEIFLFLLFFLVVDLALCAVLAIVAGFVLGWVAEFFIRHATEGRREAIRAVRWLPFKCLMSVAIVFISYQVVNVAVRHNTSLRGDVWTCRFPNGYGILMIDSTYEGFVYDTKIRGLRIEGIEDQEGTVGGVRIVQIAGRYILGGSVSGYVGPDGDVDTYFLLDTQTSKHTNFLSYDTLRNSAAQLGIPLKLEPVYDVYKRYRFTWVDLAFALLASIPPLVFGWLLLRQIARLRKSDGDIRGQHETVGLT
jgi:hypothetical protein